MCLAVRQRNVERAGARESLELEKVVSCRNDDLWGRTKLKVGSREPFDDFHWSAALGAAINGAGIVCGRGGRLMCRAQQLEAKRQSRGAPTAGQEAVMPDAYVLEGLLESVDEFAAKDDL